MSYVAFTWVGIPFLVTIGHSVELEGEWVSEVINVYNM